MQAELFEKFTNKGYERIAGGCYGNVYGKPDSPWIIKRATNDGTRTYLEWVMLKTKRGERMRGMPELDFIIPLSDSSSRWGEYLVAMKRYQSVSKQLQDHYGFKQNPTYSVNRDPACPAYINRLLEAFERDCPIVSANDVHHGNIMLDKATGDFIVTDPSSSSYRPVGSTYNEWSLTDNDCKPDDADVADFQLTCG